MKRISILFWLTLVWSQLFFAQERGCATLTVYRPGVLANSLVNIILYVNGEKVGSLVNNSSLQINIQQEGTYHVSATMGLRGNAYKKRTEKVVSLSCSEDAYIKIKGGALTAENLLQIKNSVDGGRESGEIGQKKVIKLDIDQERVVSTLTVPKAASKVEENVSNKKTIQPSHSVNRNSGLEEERTSVPQGRLSESIGDSYALIIAVNEYSDYSLNDLDQPIKDAQLLYNVLSSQYNFEKKNMQFLKNPTKKEITQVLDDYYEKLSEKDNLLIFYAGHGYWDEQFQQGYWMASDAQQNSRGSWLSNGTIRDYLRAMPTRHSLLITDACFGGGIFKSRAAFSNSSMAINQLYKLPSRKAMTSGAMSEVPDKSVFIEYLVKRLEQNTEKYLSSEQLFASFKIAVINNSSNGQVPQFGEVRETGDEGGDFIFIRR